MGRAVDGINDPSAMPRHIRAGPVVLDLFHRDARIGKTGSACIRASSGCSGGWRNAGMMHSRLDLLKDVCACGTIPKPTVW
ncbi:MAG: hypothetical protein R3D99_10140 [Altererythrobacter sp.]